MPLVPLSPLAPLNRPRRFSGLKQWLRADAGLYQDAAGTTPAVTTGDPVGLWQDQSGQGNHRSQSTASKRPTLNLGVNGQNGLACVLFDGIDDELTGSIDWSTADYVTVYLAGKLMTSGAAPAFYTITAAVQKVCFQYVLSTTRLGQNTNNADQIYTTLDATSAFRVYANLHRNNVASAYALWVDGASKTLTTSGTPLNRAFATGGFLGSFESTLWANLKIGEFLVYFAQHTQTEVDLITGYLRGRWGTA